HQSRRPSWSAYARWHRSPYRTLGNPGSMPTGSCAYRHREYAGGTSPNIHRSVPTFFSRSDTQEAVRLSYPPPECRATRDLPFSRGVGRYAALPEWGGVRVLGPEGQLPSRRDTETHVPYLIASQRSRPQRQHP